MCVCVCVQKERRKKIKMSCCQTKLYFLLNQKYHVDNLSKQKNSEHRSEEKKMQLLMNAENEKKKVKQQIKDMTKETLKENKKLKSFIKKDSKLQKLVDQFEQAAVFDSTAKQVKHALKNDIMHFITTVDVIIRRFNHYFIASS